MPEQYKITFKNAKAIWNITSAPYKKSISKSIKQSIYTIF